MKFYFLTAVILGSLFGTGTLRAEIFDPSATSIYGLIGARMEMSQEELMNLCDEFELASPGSISAEAKETAKQIRQAFAYRKVRRLYDHLFVELKSKPVDLRNGFPGLVQLERMYDFVSDFADPQQLDAIKMNQLVILFDNFHERLPPELQFQHPKYLKRIFGGLRATIDEEDCPAQLSWLGKAKKRAVQFAIAATVAATFAAPIGYGIYSMGKANLRPLPNDAVKQAHEAASPGGVSDDAREAIKNRAQSAVDKLYSTEN